MRARTSGARSCGAARWPLFGDRHHQRLAGFLPTMLWAWSVWLLPLFPVVAAATIWIYAFILVFSALWFAHYCLHALERCARKHRASPPLNGPGAPAEFRISGQSSRSEEHSWALA